MSDKENNLPTSPIPGMNGGPLNRVLANNDILFAIGVATVLATLLIPLPTFLLDLMLSCSIAVALATLLVVLSANESIEFSAFPSMLLFLTLFRLSLNVASTRLILLQGNAGQIINTFGNFVVGGNLIIGLVVFLILVIIQFIVITKGSERISEVAARFNLDAMPGKQMAIDADLNAGLIREDEARSRRQKIVSESEFYGAMDGASKFIRGDAVAGLVITAVNIIGGVIMGMMRGMTAGESVKMYSILAVGDGLVSQIPALIISTSAGFLISKASSKTNLGQDLIRQFLARSRPLSIAAFLFGGMVFVPGFPKIPFIMLALGTGMLAKALNSAEKNVKEQKEKEKKTKRSAQPEELPVEELLDVDRIAIRVGARLIKTVDPRRESSLSHRIAPLRKKFAQQYGIVLPLVRLRDDVTLDANAYTVRLNGHVVSSGNLDPDRMLAMDPGTVSERIDGLETTEPVFNLPALWINPDQKEDAEIRGYTVVDPESILVTHLSETLRRHLYEIISRDDVQNLVDRLRDKQPALVNSVVGDLAPVGLLHRVLQNLLKDGIAVRDLGRILEVIGDHAQRTKDPALLTEFVRKALVRTITEQHKNELGQMHAIVLEPALEYELRGCLRNNTEAESMNIDPEKAMRFCRQVTDVWRVAMDQGHDKTVLICDARLRPHLAGMLARQIPQLQVVAYDEIAVGTNIQSAGTVSASAAEQEVIGVPALT